MNAIIINSAPGVGKTTLLKMFEKKLLNGYALIDGDDVGRIIPLSISIDWLNLIQDNIIACAKNFKDYNTKTLIISFVFPSQERVQRLVSLLKKEGISVYHITLICEPSILKERIVKRNTTKIMNPERAIQCNNQITKLQSDYSINTTKKSPEEVGDIVCELVMKLASRSDKRNG